MRFRVTVRFMVMITFRGRLKVLLTRLTSRFFMHLYKEC